MTKRLKEAFDDALFENRRLSFPKIYKLEELYHVSVRYESPGIQEVTCQGCNKSEFKIYNYVRREMSENYPVLVRYRMAYCLNEDCGMAYVITRDLLSEELLQERREKAKILA